MDEAAQQAVQLGVNVTIFIVALSLGITLMLGVRDVAETAIEYDASIPTGSVVVTDPNEEKRVIEGYELLSYYANYISDKKIEKSGKFKINIKKKVGNSVVIEYNEQISSGKTLISYLTSSPNGIDLNSKYEIITESYNSETQELFITLKQI